MLAKGGVIVPWTEVNSLNSPSEILKIADKGAKIATKIDEFEREEIVFCPSTEKFYEVCKNTRDSSCENTEIFAAKTIGILISLKYKGFGIVKC